jgi:hypothetical protein
VEAGLVELGFLVLELLVLVVADLLLLQAVVGAQAPGQHPPQAVLVVLAVYMAVLVAEVVVVAARAAARALMVQ